MNNLQINRFILVMLTVLSILSSTRLEAQVRPRDKFVPDRSMEKRAATLVRLGRIGEATSLYLELLHSNPKNINFYFRVSELMPGQEAAPTLLQILDDLLKTQGSDLRLLTERGRLLYLLDRKEEAIRSWDQLVRTRSGDRYIYATVTGAMLKVGAFDEAIQTLLDGRSVLNDPMVFAMDLARIYAVKYDYALSSKEYLAQLDQNPRMLDHIVNQLIRFLEHEGAFEQVDGSFVEILSKPGEHQAVLLARAKLLMHEKRYEECIQAVLATDVSKSLNDVFSIANDLVADDAWSAAAKLYLHISSKSKDKAQQGKALLSLAYTYEYRLESEEKYQSLSHYFKGNSFLDLDIRFAVDEDISLERTLQLYDSLLTILPRTNQAFQASFHIAEIQLTYSGDVDRAIRGFQNIFKNTSNQNLKLEGGIRLVDAWLTKGDTSAALKILNKVIRDLNLDEDDPKIVASRIKILIHKGDIPALKKELLNLSGAASPANPLFNDGLELTALLEGNGDPADPRLQAYLRGERLIGQHKLIEAIDLLQDIQGPPTSIADEARVRAIQLLLALNKTNRASEAMDDFLESYPDSDWRPNMLIWRGEQHQFVENNMQAAIPYYETVIIEHPGYLGIQEVRIRLRNILGAGS